MGNQGSTEETACSSIAITLGLATPTVSNGAWVSMNEAAQDFAAASIFSGQFIAPQWVSRINILFANIAPSNRMLNYVSFNQIPKNKQVTNSLFYFGVVDTNTQEIRRVAIVPDHRLVVDIDVIPI